MPRQKIEKALDLKITSICTIEAEPYRKDDPTMKKLGFGLLRLPSLDNNDPSNVDLE